MEKEKDIKTGEMLLKEDISCLFNSSLGDILDVLESRFPHIRGDRSSNECDFTVLRSKILRRVNDRMRNDLHEIIGNYAIEKVYSVKGKETIMVGQRTK